MNAKSCSATASKCLVGISYSCPTPTRFCAGRRKCRRGLRRMPWDRSPDWGEGSIMEERLNKSWRLAVPWAVPGLRDGEIRQSLQHAVAGYPDCRWLPVQPEPGQHRRHCCPPGARTPDTRSCCRWCYCYNSISPSA